MSTSLEDLLGDINDGFAEALRSAIDYSAQYARPILTKIEIANRGSGDVHHAPVQHVAAVMELCAQIIPKRRYGSEEDQLRPAEIAFLIAAAWLHEVGLSAANQKWYNVYSSRAVWDREAGMSLVPGLDAQCAAIVAEMCLGHRDHYRSDTGDRIDTLKATKTRQWRGREIRVPVLTGILRTAVLLEVQHHRRVSDLGAGVEAELARTWVSTEAISGVTIEAERGIVGVRLTDSASSSERLKQVVEIWRTRVNQEFTNSVAPIFEQFKLAYRPELVSAFNQDNDGADAFHRDACEIVKLRDQIGPWQLETRPVGELVLSRRLVDKRRSRILLQIFRDADYPAKPPLVKATPRIEHLAFTAAGIYEGVGVLQWMESCMNGNGLIPLCEELRRFEDPNAAFAYDAKVVAGQNRQWLYVDSDSNDKVMLRRTLSIGNCAVAVMLGSHVSYPIAPPKVTGWQDVESAMKAANQPVGNIAQFWKECIRDAELSPLSALLEWIDGQFVARTG